MGRHLVLVGGGHAHLTTLLHSDWLIKRGHRVTLVSPAPYHYYSGMGPGMLGGRYEPQQTRFNIKKMVEDRGALFISGLATQIDPLAKTILLDSGQIVPYDIASCNTGSEVMPTVPAGYGTTMFPVKPVEHLYRARQLLLQEAARRPLAVIVLGGGPAGVEVAANVRRLLTTARYQTDITIIAGSNLLPAVPERVRSSALHYLSQLGIAVRTGNKGTCRNGGVTLTDGSTLPSDFTFIATGIKPSSLFSKSAVPVGADGGLLVNRFLQSVAHPELFGGGDCISLDGTPLAKVGVYAVRQNPVLFHNLAAALDNGQLQPFTPGGAYMLILNMGNDRGILWKRSWSMNGKLAFLLKDRIDRHFMAKFQVSGERDEQQDR